MYNRKHIMYMHVSIHKTCITTCRPSKGQRCIADVVLKNEGSLVQTCQNINVPVVNTYIC